MSSVDSLIDEPNRPVLSLTEEEIRLREMEKQQLLAGIGIPTPEARAAVPRARRGKSREDLVGDYEPPAVVVDLAVRRPDATRAIESVERMNREYRDAMSKITADAATLASLMQDAKQTQDEAEAAEEMASSAKAAAVNARIRLNDYMREHGLA